MSLTKSFAPTVFVLVRSLCSVLEMLCLDYIVQTFDSYRTLVWFAATSSTLWFRSYLWFLESFIFFSHACHLQWNTCLWNLLRPGKYKATQILLKGFCVTRRGWGINKIVLWILPDRKELRNKNVHCPVSRRPRRDNTQARVDGIKMTVNCEVLYLHCMRRCWRDGGKHPNAWNLNPRT